ncbi:primary-amine oxidase [Acidobacteria bacterium AH-259-G07]|nr:primary-amine oxidase [Acidobacteria bacterium AH-259-G07]
MFSHSLCRLGRRAEGRPSIVLAFGVFSIAIYPVLAATQLAEYPLDPLSSKELWTVYEIVKASDHLKEESRFVRVRLHEPPKSEVLNWNSGDSFRREAFVVIKQGPRTFEAMVDLLGKKVTTWREIQGVQPPSSREDWRAIEAAVKKNPDWQAAMHKRGITDFDTVRCGGVAWAYPKTAEEDGRYLAKVVSFDRRGVTNSVGRPIEGLVAIVDANELEVLKVIDSGVVPIPKGPVDYDEKSVGKLREVPTPISITQPQGPSFRVEGQEVSWQRWNFHFRIDPRVGLVISNVRYQDGDKLRYILYQGSLSEIYVPYMDPDLGWNNRLYLDVAENGGGFAGSLEPGLDCPGNAVFFDTAVADSKGIPQLASRIACLFERYDGSMAWRHNDARANHTESRRRRDLVLRMIATLGNYDYVFDWVFQQNGTIKVAVGSTGIDQVKAVASRTLMEDKEGSATRYGRFLAEYTVGVNHDHYFCFRLDLDVEGSNNSLLREELQTVELAKDGLRKRVWVVKPKIARTENEAMLKINLAKPALWRVINPNVLGPLGYPVSYQIKPIGNALPLLAQEDFPQRRGAFTQYHLWVTPFRADERHAAGAYPMYHKSEEGLHKWTKANRRIENTDIVAWYTIGFHHVVRAEDWPIMPTSWQEFELRPFDFFQRNPALDLPKKP